MNTTAAKKFALTTLNAPVLAAPAIGLAGTAHADGSIPNTAADTVNSLQAQGHHGVVIKDSGLPLERCSVISIRQDHPHEHHGGPQHDGFETAMVDVSCH